jgi:isopentenyl phosphate kinase
MAVNNLTFEQSAALLTDLYEQATGQKVFTAVDTATFTTVAQAVLKTGYDTVIESISQVLNRTIFSIRPYTAKFNGIFVDSERWGNITRKINFVDGDVENDERRTNLINTFNKLFDFGAIPVINENDSVAVEEIVYGDNDSLSAIVAKLINADALIILSDIDGLYDSNPNENEDAKLIPLVTEIDEDLYKIAGGKGSSLGTGGMVTKLHAAEITMAAGIDTIVMNGENPTEIYKALDGKQVGTFFKGK